MIMMRVSKEEIRRKIRRILGRCHIGLTMSQQVNELLDNISNLVNIKIRLVLYQIFLFSYLEW